MSNASSSACQAPWSALAEAIRNRVVLGSSAVVQEGVAGGVFDGGPARADEVEKGAAAPVERDVRPHGWVIMLGATYTFRSRELW